MVAVPLLALAAFVCAAGWVYVAGAVSLEIDADDRWNVGRPATVTLNASGLDADKANPDTLSVPNNFSVPVLVTGDPFTLGESGSGHIGAFYFDGSDHWQVLNGNSVIIYPNFSASIDFAKTVEIVGAENVGPLFRSPVSGAGVATIPSGAGFGNVTDVIVDFGVRGSDMRDRLENGAGFLNYDMRSLGIEGVFFQFFFLVADEPIHPGIDRYDSFLLMDRPAAAPSGTFPIPRENVELLLEYLGDDSHTGVIISFERGGDAFAYAPQELDSGPYPIAFDLFTFGYGGDGSRQDMPVHNQIIRLDLEETGDGTGLFGGNLSYFLPNQASVLDRAYTVRASSSDAVFVAGAGQYTLSYFDARTNATVSANATVATHAGAITLDARSYGVFDAAAIVLQDYDLDTNSDMVDVYTTALAADSAQSKPAGRMLEVRFDGNVWDDSCPQGVLPNVVLVETGASTGRFAGEFVVPASYCTDGAPSAVSSNMSVYYLDYAGGAVPARSDAAIHVGDAYARQGEVLDAVMSGVDSVILLVPDHEVRRANTLKEVLSAKTTLVRYGPDSALDVQAIEDMVGPDSAVLVLDAGPWPEIPAGSKLLSVAWYAVDVMPSVPVKTAVVPAGGPAYDVIGTVDGARTVLYAVNTDRCT